MGILPSFRGKESLANRIIQIQQDDIREQEKLIKEYLPFIIKAISETTNKYVETENSEELSIGLEAFNEAINKYNQEKGSFINFAQLVIKSRITDYMRKKMKEPVILPIENNEIIKESCFTEKMVLKEEIYI